MIIIIFSVLVIFFGILHVYLISQGGYDSHNDCKRAIQYYREIILPQCEQNYLESGFDTVDSCMNNEMGKMPDPKACGG